MGNIFYKPKSDNHNQSSERVPQNNILDVKIKSLSLNEVALSNVSEAATSGKGTPFPATGLARSYSESNAMSCAVQYDADYKKKGILKPSNMDLPINRNYSFYSDTDIQTQPQRISFKIVNIEALQIRHEIKELTENIKMLNQTSLENIKYLGTIDIGFKSQMWALRDDKKMQYQCAYNYLNNIILAGDLEPNYTFAVNTKETLDLCDHLKRGYARLQRDLEKI